MRFVAGCRTDSVQRWFCGLMWVMGVWWLSGCTPYLFSPPARFAPTELSTNPDRGQKELNANVGFHSGVFDESGPVQVQGSFAYGVTDEVALQGSVGVVHLTGQRDVRHGANQNITSLRMGVGYSPPTTRQWVRLTSGLGFGVSAAGAFFSPDVGVNLSFDNRYVVPFANYSFWVSVPERDAQVTFRWGDERYFDEDDEVVEGGFTADELVTETLPVQTTWGHTVSLGAAIRLEGVSRRIDWAAGESPRGLALVLAVHLHEMRDGEQSTGYMGFSGGFMHRF